MALSSGQATNTNGNSSGGGSGGDIGIELESLHRYHHLQQQPQPLLDGLGAIGGLGGGPGGLGGGASGSGTVSSSFAGGGTPKPKRAAVTKKLQFSTPEYSVTPIPAVSVVVSRLTPSRKR